MSDYQNCMTSAMRGFPKGLSREERGKLFCIEAKLCSGKTEDRDEAATICANRPAKESKPKKSRTKSIDAGAMATCIIGKITDSNLTASALTTYINECNGGSSGKKVVTPKKEKEKFLKKCVKENTVTGTFLEGNKMIQKCILEWKKESHDVPKE